MSLAGQFLLNVIHVLLFLQSSEQLFVVLPLYSVFNSNISTYCDLFLIALHQDRNHSNKCCSEMAKGVAEETGVREAAEQNLLVNGGVGKLPCSYSIFEEHLSGLRVAAGAVVFNFKAF